MSHKIIIPKHELINLIRAGYSNKKIGEIYFCSHKCVNSNLNRYGFLRKHVEFDNNFFENIDTEHKAYWLGYIMADGCLMSQGKCFKIDLYSKDYEQIEKWHKSINSCGNILRCNRGKYGIQYRSNHCSKKMYDDLLKCNITERKSLTLQFPENVPLNLINHLIRGIFDGDGYIGIAKTKYKPQLRFSLIGTLNIIEQCKKILNLTCKIRKHFKQYTITISGNKAVKKVMDWLYQDATVYLDRKYKLYYDHLANINKMPLKGGTKQYLAFGQYKNKYDWLKDDRVVIKNWFIINNRLSRKWDIEKAFTTPQQRFFAKAITVY